MVRRMRDLRRAVVLVAALVALTSPGAVPCNDAQPPSTPGKWEHGVDDTAMSDGTFPRKSYPALFAREDQALALLKKAVPNPVGAVVRHYHSVRGDALVKDGPVPFSLNTRLFDYYCAKAGFSQPGEAGKVLPEDETGSVFEVYFNALGWLMNDRLKLHFRAENGAAIFYVPKQGGDFHGATLYLPEVTAGEHEKAVVFTPDGRSPYKPVTRERFILAREKLCDTRIDELVKGRAWDGREQQLAQLRQEKAALEAARQALSPEERQLQAVIKEPEAAPGRRPLFATEAEGGRALATVDGKLFKPKGPRDAVRVITVYWNHDARESPKAQVLRQLEQRLDWDALKALLER